jgi:hypothetical protein
MTLRHISEEEIKASNRAFLRALLPPPLKFLVPEKESEREPEAGT